jgi:hypothetical protein
MKYNLKFMNKKSIIILAVVLTIIIVGGFLVWKGDQNVEVIEEQGQNQNQQQGEDQQAVVDTSDWKTYRNEEYGFEIELPGNMNKWSIEKKVFPKSDIYSAETVALYLNYDLDTSIQRAENDSALGMINEMGLYYISIIPIEIWRQDICDSMKDGPCYQGEVLGKNNLYVFESGFTSIEGAGYLCLEKGNMQKEFCAVDKNFGRDDIISRLNFRLIKE